MTSHEYAKKLHELAALLESRPDFNLPSYQENYFLEHGIEQFCYHGKKDDFLAAVKAVGSGQKKVDEYDMSFVALGGLLRLTVQRSAVCRIIKPAQPAEYDCDPLLSQEEEASLDGAA